MTEPVALLELREIHEYTRHVLAVYVTWFTFFLAFMFGAMAWSLRAAIDKRGYVTTIGPFLFVLGLFALQLIFGIWLTLDIRTDLNAMDQRAQTLLQALSDAHKETWQYQPKSPVPRSLHFAFELMQWVLISQLVFWLIVGVYVYVHRGRQLVSATSSDA